MMTGQRVGDWGAVGGQGRWRSNKKGQTSGLTQSLSRAPDLQTEAPLGDPAERPCVRLSTPSACPSCKPNWSQELG